VGLKEEKKKQVVAAVAAVYRYMRALEEQQLLAAAEKPVEVPAIPASLWAASGRQAIMEMRRLLQLRMIR